MLQLIKKYMKKKLMFIWLVITVISCNNFEKKEYKDGMLFKSYILNDENEFDGFYNEFYKNGNLKVSHNFIKGVLVDSSVYYNYDKTISDIRYYYKKDTVFCKTFKKNILESSGEAFKNRKIGYWNYYNVKGIIFKKQEFINLCGKHYMNQSWEYNDSNQIIKDKGNHYQIILKERKYFVGDTINIKVIYTPALGHESRNIIYVSPTISSYFCNIKEVKLDNWYSDSREFNSKVVFTTRGKKNLRGYIQEYLFQKDKPKSMEYLYREVYFDIPILIK